MATSTIIGTGLLFAFVAYCLTHIGFFFYERCKERNKDFFKSGLGIVTSICFVGGVAIALRHHANMLMEYGAGYWSLFIISAVTALFTLLSTPTLVFRLLSKTQRRQAMRASTSQGLTFS